MIWTKVGKSAFNVHGLMHLLDLRCLFQTSTNQLLIYRLKTISKISALARFLSINPWNKNHFKSIKRRQVNI